MDEHEEYRCSASTAMLALIKSDPSLIADDALITTSQQIIEFLREEWSAIIRSETASRKPFTFFIQQIVPYTSFGTRLLHDGLTELIIGCLQPIPMRSVPHDYCSALIQVAHFLHAMPFRRIDRLHIGQLDILFQNVPPWILDSMFPDGKAALSRVQAKLVGYTSQNHKPYYSDEEIIATYGISTDLRYKETYNHYFRLRKKWEAVFTSFAKRVVQLQGNLPYGEQTGLARVLGVGESLIRSWKKKILQRESWRPWQNDHFLSKRCFTDEVEEEVAQYIRQEYFEKDLLFCNSDFKQIMFDLWCQDKENWLEMDKFKCSSGFITSFKQRHRISSRKLHYKRRPTVTQEQKAAWMAYVRRLLREQDHRFIVNMDETHWQTFPNGIMTWRAKGDDAIQVRIDGNEKQGLTVLASITAAGTKLPLLLLAKGKTERCERTQIPEDIGEHYRFHSPSGWSTRDVMLKYLEVLRAQFPADNQGVEPRIHLILDMYAAHRMEDIRAAAEDLNIELHFIPPGMTDEFQPLDRRVFGCLKASGKAAFRKLYRTNPEQKFTTQSAVECLVKAWGNLSDKVLTEAWDIYTE